MADVKISELTSIGSVQTGDVIPIVRNPGVSGYTYKIQVNDLGLLYPVPEIGGRLTLTVVSAVSGADMTGVTSLYYVPFIHNRIDLWDGAKWARNTFANMSVSLASCLANKNYDVFIAAPGGVMGLELVAWTNDTTRATNLSTQDGVLVKGGDASRRYVGTIRTTGTAGQCEDSNVKRFCWNHYNRVLRPFSKYSNAVHAYTSAALRAWNNDTTATAMRVHAVWGDPAAEAILDLTGTQAAGYQGLGADTTAAFLGDSVGTDAVTFMRAGVSYHLMLGAMLANGYHYFQVIESGAASGNFGASQIRGGIYG